MAVEAGPLRGLIRGGWVVGFGGRTHTLIRDGVVVWEDGRIVNVGPRASTAPPTS